MRKKKVDHEEKMKDIIIHSDNFNKKWEGRAHEL